MNATVTPTPTPAIAPAPLLPGDDERWSQVTATATRPRTADTASFRNYLTAEEKAYDYEVEMATQWEFVPGKPLAMTCHSPFVHVTSESGRGSHSVFSGPLAGAVYTINYSDRYAEWRCSCGATKKCWHMWAFERFWLAGMVAKRSAMNAIQPPSSTITTAPNAPKGWESDEQKQAAYRSDWG